MVLCPEDDPDGAPELTFYGIKKRLHGQDGVGDMSDKVTAGLGRRTVALRYNSLERRTSFAMSGDPVSESTMRPTPRLSARPSWRCMATTWRVKMRRSEGRLEFNCISSTFLLTRASVCAMLQRTSSPVRPR